MTKRTNAARTPVNMVPVQEIPQVLALQEVQVEIDNYIKANRTFYDGLLALVEKRNQIFQEAEKIVREASVSCGPFVKLSDSVKINVEKLYEELGEDTFKEFGGYTETVVDYKLDRPRFLSYLASGAIPKEVSDLCVRTESRYQKPDVYVLP